MQPPVVPDPQAHVMGVLNGGKIQMLAPDKGAQGGQEFFTRRDVTGAGPGLDIGGAFPCPAHAFVIAFSGGHRQADWRDAGIRAQPQVGAEHIALIGIVRQKCGHPPGDPDECGPRVGDVGRVKAGFVEQADQVDVGRIIQLERAALAHRQCDHPARSCGITRSQAGQFAPGNLGPDKAAQTGIHRRISQSGQGAGDGFQRPDPAQIGQGGQQGKAGLGLAQRWAEFIGGAGADCGQDRVGGRFGGIKTGTQPCGFAGQQPR